MGLKKKKIAVVMGGWSAEREVSLSSGQGVVKALTERGFDVKSIDLTRDLKKFLHDLEPRPDVVFLNSIHGRWGEDGCIQGLIEMLGIPYTNSSLLASAIAMDKPTSLKLFREAGIPFPQGKVVSFEDVVKGGVLSTPYVIKPLREGSSVGVSIIQDESQLETVKKDWAFGSHVLVESYIPGKEIQVAVLGDKAIGAIEIRPKEAFYDYKAKYTAGFADHIMPASLSPNAYEEALDLALQAHKALGCEGVTRVDMRYDDTNGEPGRFYVLEVNTQPGLTPLSLVPEIAAHVGISYADLLEWMIENPRCPS